MHVLVNGILQQNGKLNWNYVDKEKKPQVICVNGAGNFRFGPFNRKEGAEDNLRQFKHLYNNVEWQ